MTALRNGTHEQREAPYQHLTQTSRVRPPVNCCGAIGTRWTERRRNAQRRPRAIRILGENSCCTATIADGPACWHANARTGAPI